MAKDIVPAHACSVRRNSIDVPAGGTVYRRGLMVPARSASVTMWSGYRSCGYQTNYQRVPMLWVEAIVMGESPVYPVIRKCWRFSGAGAQARADKAYSDCLSNLADTWPGASATFPTSQSSAQVA